MKRIKLEPSMMTPCEPSGSGTSEPTDLEEPSEMNCSDTVPISYMQSFNNVALRNIFSFLNTKELEVASRVCTSWNMVSKDKIFWRRVYLKHIMINDWNMFIDLIIRQNSTMLNTKNMFIPTKYRDSILFWQNFSHAIKRATNLRVLELYKCPTNVIQDCIIALPQLTVFNGASIVNSNEIIVNTYGINRIKSVDLTPVSLMTDLTSLMLKAVPGIKLDSSSTSTFDHLTKLRILSLTSIKSFSHNLCQSLKTVTTSLEILEIGDCKGISSDLPMLLKRFTNLKRLRLENCCFNREKKHTEYLIVAIRSLKKLKILELVNILITETIEEELGNCTGLDCLLLVPLYIYDSALDNQRIIGCLKRLSKTLKYLVWGHTCELLRLNMAHYQHQTDPRNVRRTLNIIPILRQYGPHPSPLVHLAESRNSTVDIFSVIELQQLLKEMLVNTKIKVVKLRFPATTQVHINEYFKELEHLEL